MFAHSPTATAEVVAAVGEGCPDLPRWAKLSPTVADLAEVAGAALAAGAEAVTLVNTVLAMAIDVDSAPAASRVRPAGWRPVGTGRPPGGGAGRVRRPSRSSRCHHHRGGRGDDRSRRHRTGPGRRRRRAGGHGHLPGSARARQGPRPRWRHGAPATASAGCATSAGRPMAETTRPRGFAARVAAAVAPVGPAVCRHRPVGRAARRLGALRPTPTDCAVRAAVRRGVRRGGPGGQAPGGVLRAMRIGRRWPRWRRSSPRPGRPGCWSSPTPSGATSGARWRRTPRPGSIPTAPWGPMP